MTMTINMNRPTGCLSTALILLLGMLFSIPVSAQPVPSAAREDVGLSMAKLSQAEVASLLSKIEVTFLTTTSLGTAFEQEKKISFFDDTIRSTGALFFQSPDKVRMDTFTPFKTSAVANGPSAIQYEFVNGGWRSLDTATNGMLHAVMKNIISWLQGKFNDASLYQVTGARKDHGTWLTLTPKKSEYQKHIKYFELGINKAVNGLDSILIMLPDGDYTRYKFYNDRINVPLSPDLFDAKAPAPAALPPWLDPAQ
ncbi:MAG: outer membrane lipoprotein carrier protein LolA [Desulfobacterium sp.]|nr:outer membrane lipoprotein carrier protein LolA [Desulfobacterium sp.]